MRRNSPIYNSPRLMQTRRRGLSFIEVITSIVIIGIVSTALLATVSIITRTVSLTTDYMALKIYAANKFETIQTDLEIGEDGGKSPIDAINYNDDGQSPTINGEPSGIIANVVVTEIQDVFGESLYFVELDMRDIDSGVAAKTSSLLRKGCTAHAP